MAGDDQLDPSEIEALLNAAGGGGGAGDADADAPVETPAADPPAPAPADDAPGGELLDANEIEALLQQQTSAPAAGPDDLVDRASANLAAAVAPTLDGLDPPPMEGAEPFGFEDFSEPDDAPRTVNDLAALNDVELDLRIELGRTELLIDEVLALKQGSVVPLDKLAGDPVDVLVNGQLIARGEVLVLNDNFCVRVAEILVPEL